MPGHCATAQLSLTRGTFVGWEWLIALVRDTNSTVLIISKKWYWLSMNLPQSNPILVKSIQGLETRHAEIEAADENCPAPNELYLTTEELRAKIDQQQRLELRTLGRAAAEIDQALALDAEAPQIQVGRGRGTRYRCFSFPIAGPATNRMACPIGDALHGRLSDLANQIKVSRDEASPPWFVCARPGNRRATG